MQPVGKTRQSYGKAWDGIGKASASGMERVGNDFPFAAFQTIALSHLPSQRLLLNLPGQKFISSGGCMANNEMNSSQPMKFH
jgi:hypothetical protein